MDGETSIIPHMQAVNIMYTPKHITHALMFQV